MTLRLPLSTDLSSCGKWNVSKSETSDYNIDKLCSILPKASLRDYTCYAQAKFDVNYVLLHNNNDIRSDLLQIVQFGSVLLLTVSSKASHPSIPEYTSPTMCKAIGIHREPVNT